MKKTNKLLILTLILFSIFSINAKASTIVAKIGENNYETLDEAINAALDGETIELLSNAILNTNTLDKNLTIEGNNKEITIGKLNSDDGRLSLRKTLTLNNAIIHHQNTNEADYAIGLYLYSTAVLNLNHSEYNIKTHGVYTSPDATINLNDSKFSATQIKHDAFMQVDEAGKYSYINLKNKSTLIIDDVKRIMNSNGALDGGNGTNWFSILADDSNISVTNCEYQGLVGGALELKNGATANYDNNGIGIVLYATDYVKLNENTELSITNSDENAIWLSRNSSLEVKDTATLTATGNGKKIDASGTDANNGTINNRYATAIFEDNANVKINDNYMRGISNTGTTYVGTNTEIMNNGLITKEGTRVPQYGGGVYNKGTITIAENAKLYNNHATLAADDIYSTGILRFKEVGENWILDDCNDKINGWYDDAINHRWNAHDLDHIYVNLVTPDIYEGELTLKAAHDNIGKVIINYVDDEGNKLTEEITLTGEVGSSYLTEKKNFDGYTFIKVEGDPEGKFDFNNTYITYYYTKYTSTGDVEVTPPKTGVGEENSKTNQTLQLNIYKKEEE